MKRPQRLGNPHSAKPPLMSPLVTAPERKPADRLAKAKVEVNRVSPDRPNRIDSGWKALCLRPGHGGHRDREEDEAQHDHHCRQQRSSVATDAVRLVSPPPEHELILARNHPAVDRCYVLLPPRARVTSSIMPLASP